MTRLSLGQIDAALSVMPRVVELAPQPSERRRFSLLLTVMQICRPQNGAPTPGEVLAKMDDVEEDGLLEVIRSLGHLDTSLALVQALAQARPASATAREALFEATLVKARSLLQRCDWAAAASQLLALHEASAAPPARAVLLNLLGCCACLSQDMKKGIQYFAAALRLAGRDARLQQNLALAHEWLGNFSKAETYWNRYFELLDEHVVAPPGRPDYGTRLAFEGYTRLSNGCAEREQWSTALAFAQRAHALRPNDPDTLEKLFHLYTQAGRSEDARRVLRELRRVRPSEPELELYELDLVDVRSLNEIEQMLTNVERLLKRTPNDARVEVRAAIMVGNVLPFLDKAFGQLSDQLGKTSNQVRYLPKYQIDWSAVREVARDLRGEFQRLRRLGNKCFALVSDDEQRRTIGDLTISIDRKIEQCRSLGG
jgi:tetratricopeptide (TPR) repeat protein